MSNLTKRIFNFARISFLNELDTLLRHSGIKPLRQAIRAEADSREDRYKLIKKEHSLQIGRVIIYIDENLTNQLTLDELADEAQLSKYQLIRRFHKEEDITPWKYLIRKRIEKAKTLLEDGRSPGQVAVETGFYDQSHFSKTFREESGQTPTEYQEQNFKNRN